MKRKTPMPAADFVTLWQRAESRQEVAKACRQSVAIVSARASFMRRGPDGVKLKKFTRGGGHKLDRRALNKIAKKEGK